MMTKLIGAFGGFPLPVLGIVARSGTGKTTLLTKLIPALREAGLRVAVIKHSHHDIEMDKPGKDSHRLREAGAQQVMLASPYRTFWVGEGDGETEPALTDLLAQLDISNIDLVLLEGYRTISCAKIEVHRDEVSGEPLAMEDQTILAVASDLSVDIHVPVLPLNNIQKIRDFVLSLLP